MNKLVLILTLPMISMLDCNANKTLQSSKPAMEEASLAFADLSEVEKTEFIEHVIATGDCSWEGFELYGKVQFVTSFPDIKIQYVTSFPDIKVQWVTSFPDQCGKWQEVTSFPDFKVQVVTSFPDLKVQEVSSFPGMN